MAEPVRTCVICRTKAMKSALHRFVWEDGRPLLDEYQQKSGRGAYCCRCEKCLQKFLSRRQRWLKIFNKQ